MAIYVREKDKVDLTDTVPELPTKVKMDLLSQVAAYVAFEILNKLDAISIKKLGFTCKRWQALSNDQMLWKYLIRRDFGAKGVLRATWPNFQGSYFFLSESFEKKPVVH